MRTLTLSVLDKPLSQLSLGTGWFDGKYEKEIFELLDAYVELGAPSWTPGGSTTAVKASG